MATVVIETNYKRFAPILQADECKQCSSGCQISCQQVLPADRNVGVEWSFEHVHFDDDEW
ncbi:MAG: hypothetical protein FWD00_02520 [Clostridiales bacterium]|nr:hypothetical protein [Clostridiales bacterium]